MGKSWRDYRWWELTDKAFEYVVGPLLLALLFFAVAGIVLVLAWNGLWCLFAHE